MPKTKLGRELDQKYRCWGTELSKYAKEDFCISWHECIMNELVGVQYSVAINQAKILIPTQETIKEVVKQFEINS